jgi:hypothetical protein
MKQVEREILLDWWLQKYHNTNCKEIIEKYPKETLENPDWFKMFPVTKDQEKEWIDWAKKYIKNVTKMGKYLLERQWPYVYLDCSPYVIED